jgi:hypothetical protein
MIFEAERFCFHNDFKSMPSIFGSTAIRSELPWFFPGAAAANVSAQRLQTQIFECERLRRPDDLAAQIAIRHVGELSLVDVTFGAKPRLPVAQAELACAAE